MRETTTTPAMLPVADHIAAIPDARKRADAGALVALYERVTGQPAMMWGPSMIGFGHYDYVYDSGHAGRAMRGGFAPRKGNVVLYLNSSTGNGDIAESPLLAKLGKHKTSKACLYVKKLADIDAGILRQLIEASVQAMEPQRVRA